MIYQTVDQNEFIRAFEAYGRGGQFSREGLEVLFDYIEDCSRDIGENVELDVIGICCEWTEYSSWEEAAREYAMQAYELEDHTTVLTVGPDDTGPVLVLNF